jgi:hypothetical protein
MIPLILIIRMSYIILRGRWCNIIVVNVHAPCEDTSDDIKDSFYEELRRVIDQIPRYDMKILLGKFNAKVGREDIFKPTIGNESSHEVSNDNGLTNGKSQLLYLFIKGVIKLTGLIIEAYHCCQLHTKFYLTFFCVD